MSWIGAIFREAFHNIGSDPEVHAAGERSAAEIRAYADELMTARAAELAAGQSAPDDLLTRLITLQGDPDTRLDDGDVRRNLVGLSVAGVEAIRAVSHVADELLRRPGALGDARTAAMAGDMPAVTAHVLEALRFHPTNPVLPRRVGRPTTLAAGTRREHQLGAGGSVVAAILAAMFDPTVFEDPGSYRTDRPASDYVHFGRGLHQCFARRINLVFIPEVVGALVRLERLRRAPGRAGKLSYDGPLPDRLVVDFDARPGAMPTSPVEGDHTTAP